MNISTENIQLKPLSGIIIGGESYVNITWQEVKMYVDNGAIVLTHNHTENYDNLHSPADLILQLKSGLKYCIVESYTKRYIVKNSNKQLTDDDQLVRDISDFNYKFRKKIDELTDERLVRLTENTELDYWETENLRKQIKEKVLEEHINEYEDGMSKFFEEGTGLTLYVHDK